MWHRLLKQAKICVAAGAVIILHLVGSPKHKTLIASSVVRRDEREMQGETGQESGARSRRSLVVPPL